MPFSVNNGRGDAYGWAMKVFNLGIALVCAGLALAHKGPIENLTVGALWAYIGFLGWRISALEEKAKK